MNIGKDLQFKILLTGMLVISLSLMVFSVLPTTKEMIRDFIVSNSRNILAKADADLTGNGYRVSIIKVESADSLALEIFEGTGDSSKLQFVKRLVLPHRLDGYFNFRGNGANLVVTDLDNDGILEIIAPTFDENLIPRLNVYKFDPESKDFFKMGPDSFHL